MTTTTAATTADKGELLPCPFCGSKAEESWPHEVRCTNRQCDASGVPIAIGTWESRPTNEGESILPLTESKTQTIIRKGYKITGYVLTHDDGRKAISDMQAVRWLEQGEFYGLMHPAPVVAESATTAGEGVGLPEPTLKDALMFAQRAGFTRVQRTSTYNRERFHRLVALVAKEYATATSADKGEQECREAFEEWAITQEWIAPVKNHEPFSRECYPDGDYDITAVRAAWAAWNRRPTNEGQDGLTAARKQVSSIIEALAEIVKLGDQSKSDSDPEVILRPPVMVQVVRIRDAASAIARHLSTHPAPDDQQAKDAARYRKLRGMHWSDSMLCVVSEPKESVKIGCYCPSGEQLDAAIDAALSTTKQEEV